MFNIYGCTYFAFKTTTKVIEEVTEEDIKNAVERGEISYSGDAAPLSAERMHESIRKINKLIEINGNIMKGEVTQNPNNKVVEIKTAEQLRQGMDSIVAGEGRINKLFNTGKESLKFDFDSLDEESLDSLDVIQINFLFG